MNKISISLNRQQIEALTIYQQKFKELDNTKFINFYKRSKSLKFISELKKVDNYWIGNCSLNEPNEELVNSFILIFRFFVQDNESCSLRNLHSKILPLIKCFFPQEVKRFNSVRNDFNKFLDSKPQIQIKLSNGRETKIFSSNREILDVFLYGNYAHANNKQDKKKWFDFIHLNVDEGYKISMRNIFRLEVISILLVSFNILQAISNEIKLILDKTINYYIEVAEKEILVNPNRAKNFFLYALTIANKLSNKSLIMELCKYLSEIYLKLVEEEKARDYLNRYKEIKFSIELPNDFWNDKEYRDYYNMPKEFRSILNNIHLNSNLKEPIIVLPLKCFKEILKFKELIGVRNFKISQDKKRIRFERININNNPPCRFIQEIELDHENIYLYEFAFLNYSGFLYFTNSPELFARAYLFSTELRDLIKNQSKNGVLLNFYIKFLRDIQDTKKLNPNIISDLKKIKQLESLTFELHNPDELNNHIEAIQNILGKIINISIYPKLKLALNLEEDLENIKKHAIIPYLNENYKGIDWLSLALTKILYMFNSEQYPLINEIIDSNLAKLKEICERINGKHLNEKFLEDFFEFCENYLQNLIESNGF